jgi:hypothetical protein
MAGIYKFYQPVYPPVSGRYLLTFKYRVKTVNAQGGGRISLYCPANGPESKRLTIEMNQTLDTGIQTFSTPIDITVSGMDEVCILLDGIVSGTGQPLANTIDLWFYEVSLKQIISE